MKRSLVRTGRAGVGEGRRPERRAPGHADDVLEELTDAKTRAVAEKVFRALAGQCGVGESPGEVLKLAALREAVGGDERDVAFVVDAFRREGRSFLTPPAALPLTGRSLVEISYEEVIHNGWGLKSWAEVSGQAS